MTETSPTALPVPRATDIDEALIRRIVFTFYARVRTDPELGPVFERAIGDDWGPHLEKMCDFWSSITLRSGRYSGSPAIAHMRHKTIRPEHFDIWLGLWVRTVSELATGAAEVAFTSAAHRMGHNLRGMLYAHRP